MYTVCIIFAWLLAVVCLVGVARIAAAVGQGKKRKALYWVAQTLVLLWGLTTFVWFVLLHWTRDSPGYIALACMVPVYCHRPLSDYRRAIPDREW